MEFKLFGQSGVIDRIRQDLTSIGSSSAWHISLLLRALSAVLRSSLFTIGNAGGVESSSNNVITDAGQILDTAAADQHNRVLLQIVADAWNICSYFNPIREAHASHFPQRRIRLLGGSGVHASANSTLLGTCL